MSQGGTHAALGSQEGSGQLSVGEGSVDKGSIPATLRERSRFSWNLLGPKRGSVDTAR